MCLKFYCPRLTNANDGAIPDIPSVCGRVPAVGIADAHTTLVGLLTFTMPINWPYGQGKMAYPTAQQHPILMPV